MSSRRARTRSFGSRADALYAVDGNVLGEAHYAFPVKEGETIVTGAGRKFRVLDVVPFEDDAAIEPPVPTLGSR
jgi:hypothetical protein